MSIPELKLNGYADVLSIGPCPPISTGAGEVVTATYVTNKANVIDLTFENSDGPIGTTAEHPFWSETRQEFVEAGKLKIGEEVLTLNGQRTRLSDITPRAGPETVYNFEVANQHVYYVSRDGLLVHNAVYAAKVLSNGRLLIFGKSGRLLRHNKANIRAARRLLATQKPTGVPSSWLVKPAKNGIVTRYIDPQNFGNSVRVMAGNASARFNNSRNAYAVVQKNGQQLDRFGNVGAKRSADTHIPLHLFRFNNIKHVFGL